MVPYWISDSFPQPISHAWAGEKDRVDVLTPINGMEWPVPIPKDTNLNLIRIEMLNLGVQYTWLDVLCLRQKGGEKGGSACRGVETGCSHNWIHLSGIPGGDLSEWAEAGTEFEEG